MSKHCPGCLEGKIAKMLKVTAKVVIHILLCLYRDYFTWNYVLNLDERDHAKAKDYRPITFIGFRNGLRRKGLKVFKISFVISTIFRSTHLEHIWKFDKKSSKFLKRFIRALFPNEGARNVFQLRTMAMVPS